MPSPRTRAAVVLGRATRRISRRLGQGSGAVIGGRVTSLVAPQALHELADGMEAVAVSGTNGKTTTTRLVATALRTLGPASWPRWTSAGCPTSSPASRSAS
jgi:UDP-N-acetylmuramate-alanine ligase